MRNFLLLGLLIFHFSVKSQDLRMVIPIASLGEQMNLVFSPNGEYIAFSAGGTIQIWQVRSKKQIFNLKGHDSKEYINSIRFSQDGMRLITTSSDRTCKVWNLKNGLLNYTISLYNDYGTDGFFTNDPEVIFLKDGSLLKKTLILKDSVLFEHSIFRANSFLFNEEKNLAFVGFDEGQILIFDTENWNQVDSITKLKGNVKIQGFDPVTMNLYASSWFSKLLEINVLSGKSEKISTDGDIESVTIDSTHGRAYVESSERAWSYDISEKSLNEIQKNGICVVLKDGILQTSGPHLKVCDFHFEEKWTLPVGIEYIPEVVYSPESDFIASIGAGEVWLIDSKNPNEKYLLNGIGNSSSKPIFSSMGTYMFIENSDALLEIENARIISTPDEFRYYFDLDFSKDERYLIGSGYDSIKILDLNNLEIIFRMPSKRIAKFISNRYVLAYSADYSDAYNTSDYYSEFEIIDILTSKLIFSDSVKGRISDASISPLETGFLIISLENLVDESTNNYYERKLVTLYDQEALEQKFSFVVPTYCNAEFSFNGRYILVNDSPLRIHSVVDGSIIKKFDKEQFYYIDENGEEKWVIENCIYSDKGEFILCNDNISKGYTSIYDLKKDTQILDSCMIPSEKLYNHKNWNPSFSGSYSTKKLVEKIQGYYGQVALSEYDKEILKVLDPYADFLYRDPKGKYLITVNSDGIIAVRDYKTSGILYECAILSKEDYFFKIPETGYYFGTKYATRNVYYVTPDRSIIPFDLNDCQLNRPDKVLTYLSEKGWDTDTSMVQAYRRAWMKRISRLGLNTLDSNFQVNRPEIKIVNKNEIPLRIDSDTLSVHLNGKSTDSPIMSLNVLINEVPIFGVKGINWKTSIIDTTILITLASGNNKIEVYITDDSGSESIKDNIQIISEGTLEITPKTHFIGIGIEKFNEPGHDLSYSVKDIRDLSKALKEKLGEQLILDTLFNQNVSVSNVAALRNKLMETNINDNVIIAYSGHGLLNADYDYFLSAYHVDFHHPEKGGIPYDVLESLLDSIPARKKLLLIDACHSGEVDKDDLMEMNKIAGAKGIVEPRGELFGKLNLGLKNSFQLMQELFVNVQKGSGATIISAAAGNQFALEGGGLENGFFTYAILEYMKTHEEVAINDLKKYVYEEVERLSGGMQKPTSRIENLELDWKVW